MFDFKYVDYIIYSDLHKGAPHEIDELIFPPDTEENVVRILLGDNFDRKNCKKSDFEKIDQEMQKYFKMYGRKAVGGNHELIPFEERPHYLHMNIIFVHGDILWGTKKMKDFRSKPLGGAGYFKRRLVATTNAARALWPVKLDENEKEILYKYAKKYNCDTIVIGHKHPKEVLHYIHKDVKIYVVPRGTTVLKLKTELKLRLVSVEED